MFLGGDRKWKWRVNKQKKRKRNGEEEEADRMNRTQRREEFEPLGKE